MGNIEGKGDRTYWSLAIDNIKKQIARPPETWSCQNRSTSHLDGYETKGTGYPHLYVGSM